MTDKPQQEDKVEQKDDSNSGGAAATLLNEVNNERLKSGTSEQSSQNSKVQLADLIIDGLKQGKSSEEIGKAASGRAIEAMKDLLKGDGRSSEEINKAGGGRAAEAMKDLLKSDGRSSEEINKAGGGRAVEALKDLQKNGGRVNEITGSPVDGHREGGCVIFPDKIPGRGKDSSPTERGGDLLPSVNNGDKIGLPSDISNFPRDRVSHKIDFVIPPTKDGVEKLSTGDFLVTKDGAQTLFTPSGDQVSVNKDGSFNVKGNVKEVKTGKDGSTTISFKDGTEVRMDSNGISGIYRNNSTVEFVRNLNRHNDLKPTLPPVINRPRYEFLDR